MYILFFIVPVVAGDDDVHIIMSMLINMYLNFAYISLYYACSSSRTTLRILDEFSIAAVAVTQSTLLLLMLLLRCLETERIKICRKINVVACIKIHVGFSAASAT